MFDQAVTAIGMLVAYPLFGALLLAFGKVIGDRVFGATKVPWWQAYLWCLLVGWVIANLHTIVSNLHSDG